MNILTAHAPQMIASFRSGAERGEVSSNPTDAVEVDKSPPSAEASTTRTTTRAEADAEVASSFASLLLDGHYKTSIRPPDVQAPPNSTVALWYAQLDSAFKSEGFVTWAKRQGLDTRYLTLIPARGEIKGYVDGRLKTFYLSDDSGWSDVSRTLLALGRVFAPEHGQVVQYPGRGQGGVSMTLVAQFYKEPDLFDGAQVSVRLKQLADNPGFNLEPRHQSSLSDTALAAHRQALGDEATRHSLVSALSALVDDADGRINLEQINVPIDPRSALFDREPSKTVSLARMLKLEGYKMPTNSAQAHALASALAFDLAHRAPGEDAGGVRHIRQRLSSTSLRKMAKLVKAQIASDTTNSPGAGTLLSRLISHLPDNLRKAMADYPSIALDQLLRTPEAQRLGNLIQEVLKVIDTPTSATESLGAGLIQELDPGLGKSRFNLAGYNLYSADNAGASSAEIVKRFTTHLAGRVGNESAAVAAQLLLSAAAPEFLVKNIPPNLVYGSHTWTNFCIEVSRIEQQVPGAAANMTFSQVMAFGNTPPVSIEGEDQLNFAARDPIIDWGIANRVIDTSPTQTYSDAQAEQAQRILNKQQKELRWASNAMKTAPTTRRELALAELKRVFPQVDPTLEVMQQASVKHKPISLLDIYMTGPIQPDYWISTDEQRFPYGRLKSRLSELTPDINKVFAAKFQEYRKVQEAAWAMQFKYQLSLLPMADRLRISQSDVSFFEVSRAYIKNGPCTSGLFTPRDCLPPTPTEQELEALKGRHGLLMKVVEPDGNVSAYSYFPAEGKIVKEDGFPGRRIDLDDRSYFGGGSEGYIPGLPHTYAQYGGTDTTRDPPALDGKKQGDYFSDKSGALAHTASGYFTKDYGALQKEAAGVTEIEKGRAYDEKLKGFFLSLVPFYDGIQDAIKGDVGGAVFNLGFDILGFVIPGANAARKAAKAGKGVLNIIKSGVVAGVGASVGYTDSVDIAKNLNKGARAGYKDVKYLTEHGHEVLSRLKGHYGSYDVTKVYKEGDVVKGFFHAAEDNVWRPVVAVFKKGGWYAYNLVSKTPFGVQLAQFGAVSSLQR
ncbi:hypothetical protein SO486_20980 [Pseudomonas salmasensis]|uniref:Uncharacterized protein n=1 Tax=Pseudomonas salmasensis TaxID=2745514 RepID=A0ABU5FKY7_9PSED|nr:hypothetical protein [Pseudomonas salmasensis]MDY4302447.1 hypothetical protein [Pseudomonas salmasensis]